MKGYSQVYWAYPALVVVFYLIKPRTAIVLTTLSLFGLLPILVGLDLFTQLTVIITLILTTIFAYIFASRTSEQRDLLLQQATRDPLTGIRNRRAFDEKIEDVIRLQQRVKTKVSLLLLDLDHFKTINDTYGHAEGDEILIRITEIIKLRIRTTDHVYRLGGEEFVVMVERADIHAAAKLAEQFRTLVEACELKYEHPVTVSIGVAEYADGESADSWLRRADQAMFEGKRSGRNQVCLAK